MSIDRTHPHPHPAPWSVAINRPEGARCEPDSDTNTEAFILPNAYNPNPRITHPEEWQVWQVADLLASLLEELAAEGSAPYTKVVPAALVLHAKVLGGER